jgi:hypothetical protein
MPPFAAVFLMATVAGASAALVPPAVSSTDNARLAAETMAMVHMQARNRCATPGACPSGPISGLPSSGIASAVTVRSNGAGMLVTAWAPPAGSRWASVSHTAIVRQLDDTKRRMRVSTMGGWSPSSSLNGSLIPSNIGGLSLSQGQPFMAASF